MAAYAEVADVLARAGAVRGAFSEDSEVDLVAIDRFLLDVSDTLNGYLVGRGASLPLDVTGAGTLRGVAADGALVLALEGAFPGRTTDLPESVAALLAGARARYNAAISAIMSGKHSVTTYIDSLATSPGASDFWSAEPGYSEWTDIYGPGMGPGARKTDYF